MLVTGASSGIGEATARQAAARGASVVLLARRSDELERVRAAIADSGGRVTAYVCDVTDGGAVDAVVERMLAEHGAVDYLVNNAGRSIRRSLALTHGRLHDFERTMAVNYFAPVRLTMGLLPAMREQHFGHVVNVLSWGVQVRAPKFTAYLASKSALDTWSRIAGRETYADNVTFTNIRFGLVRTDMVVPTGNVEDRRSLSAEQAGAIVVRALEERPVTVNTVAGTVGEWVGLLAPRLSDAFFHRMHGGLRTRRRPAAKSHLRELTRDRTPLRHPRRRPLPRPGRAARHHDVGRPGCSRDQGGVTRCR